MNIVETCRKYVENRGFRITRTGFSCVDGPTIKNATIVTITAAPISNNHGHIDTQTVLHGTHPITKSYVACTATSLRSEAAPIMDRSGKLVSMTEPIRTTVEFTCFIPKDAEHWKSYV